MVPEGWRSRQVSDICRLQNGHGFKPEEWDVDGLPIIRIQNLNGNQNFNYYSGAPEPDWLVPPGQMLFAWAGTKGVSFGPTIWKGKTGVLNQHIFKVFAEESIDQDWLYYCLKHVTHMIERRAHGFKATLVHVKKSEIDQHLVHVPPIGEQKRIAEILFTWDRAIECIEKLIENRERQKRGLTNLLVTAKTRFPQFRGQKFTSTKLNRLCTIRRGASPRPISDRKWFAEKGPGWVRIADVTASDTEFLEETEQYLSTLGVEKSVSVDPGELIMSICATIGVPKIVGVPVCIHDGFVVFRDLSQNLEPSFLYHYLDFYSGRLANSGQPGTQKNLNTTIVGNIDFPAISAEEQRAIAHVLDVQDREIRLYRSKLIQLRKEKTALMQELLTGRRRTKLEKAVAA